MRDMNKDTQLLALDFIDYSVDDGKMPLWTQVSSKEFLTTLINLLKTRDSPEVNGKILFLIEKWGKRFEKYQEILPNFTEIYNGLKSSKVIFPDNIHSTYSNYLMSNEEIEEYNNDRTNYSNNYNENANEDYNQSSSLSVNSRSFVSYSTSINVDLKQSSYEKKYRKLVDKLAECVNCIEVLNDKIDKSGGRVDDTIKSIATSLRHGNKQLVDTISSDKLKNEALMEISLGVAEDVNRTLKRFDVLVKGRKPDPFLSYFVESNAKNSESTYTGRRELPVNTYSNDNTNSNANFDIFQGYEVSSHNNNNQSNQYGLQQNQINNSIQKNTDTVNDLFDIFSNPPPVNNSNQNNQMSNIQFNQNNVIQPHFYQQQQPQLQPQQKYPYMNSNINPIEETYINQSLQLENKQDDLFAKINLAYNQDNPNQNYTMNTGNNSNINFNNPISNMNYSQSNQLSSNSNHLDISKINQSPNQFQMEYNLPHRESNLNSNIEINNNPITMGYNINNQFNSQSPNFGMGINQPISQNYNQNQNYNTEINANQLMNNQTNENKGHLDKLHAIDLLF